jgi:hypothetical protein
MVPVLVLAVIAAVLIRSLMSVVARDEAGDRAAPTADFAPAPAYDLTVELRANVNDDVRAFLLPAVAEPAPFERASFEPTAFEHASLEQTGGTVTDANES